MNHANHPIQKWAGFIKAVRGFFDSRGFTEVSTASLVPQGAFENALDPLKVTFQGGHCELHTSPEMEMKGVLSKNPESIYQICKCFRDDPDTGIHFKEFTMLEFYRVEADYRTTQKDLKELLVELSGEALAFMEITIEQAFQKYAGLDLGPLTNRESLAAEVTRKNLTSISPSDTWEDIFFKILLEKIEPALPKERPVLVRDYPASVSTLAKTNSKGWGERFEIYWKGMEICNGATELTDAEELKRRYEFEKAERLKAGKAPHPFPDSLYQSLKNLPACSGVAVGLDRLFWALNPRQGH